MRFVFNHDLGSMYQFSIVTGILISQFAGIPFAVPGTNKWRILLALGAVIPLVQLALLPFVSETPHYFVSRNKRDRAIKAVSRITGTSTAAYEVDSMIEANDRIEFNKAVGIFQLFTLPQWRKTLLIAMFVHLAQQLACINGINSYSTSVFKLYFEPMMAKMLTSIMGCVYLVATLVSVSLIDVLGRRTLILTSQLGVVSALALLVISQLTVFKWGAVIGRMLFF